jgi:ribosome biogenesis GTPase
MAKAGTTTGRAASPAGAQRLVDRRARALQLIDVKAGLDDVFADIVALAQTCPSATAGMSEPAAVRQAIEAGSLDGSRQTLATAAGEAYNAESLADRRARDRTFGKVVSAS